MSRSPAEKKKGVFCADSLSITIAVLWQLSKLLSAVDHKTEYGSSFQEFILHKINSRRFLRVLNKSFRNHSGLWYIMRYSVSWLLRMVLQRIFEKHQVYKKGLPQRVSSWWSRAFYAPQIFKEEAFVSRYSRAMIIPIRCTLRRYDVKGGKSVYFEIWNIFDGNHCKWIPLQRHPITYHTFYSGTLFLIHSEADGANSLNCGSRVDLRILKV